VIRTGFYISDFESILDRNDTSVSMMSKMILKNGLLVSEKSFNEISKIVAAKTQTDNSDQPSRDDAIKQIQNMLRKCRYLIFNEVRNRTIKYENSFISSERMKEKAIVCWVITNDENYLGYLESHKKQDEFPLWFYHENNESIIISPSALLNSECTEAINDLFLPWRGGISNMDRGSPLFNILGDLIRSKPPEKDRGIHIQDPHTLECIEKYISENKTRPLDTVWDLYNLLTCFSAAKRPLEINLYSAFSKKRKDNSNSHHVSKDQIREIEKILQEVFHEIFKDLKKKSRINLYISSKKPHQRFILFDSHMIWVDQYSSKKDKKIPYQIKTLENDEWNNLNSYRDEAMNNGNHLRFDIGCT